MPGIDQSEHPLSGPAFPTSGIIREIDSRLDAPDTLSVSGLGECKVQSCGYEHVDGYLRLVCPDMRAQFRQDALYFLALFDSHLTQFISLLQRHHRLDENRCATIRDIVDETFQVFPRFHLDRYDKSARPFGDDRLLDDLPAFGRADERLEPVQE